MSSATDPERRTGAIPSQGMPLYSVQALTEVFVCPSCRGELQADAQGPRCPKCSTRGRLLAGSLVDFLGGDDSHAQAILGWREDQVPSLEDAVTQATKSMEADPRAPVALSLEQAALLRDLDLLGPDGRLTPLGRTVGYNSSEFRWQSNYDPLEGLATTPELTPESRVLDLGGGSGQTLRRLFPEPKGTVVCLDPNPDVLAYGVKLFSTYGLNALFCRGSAHSLPFRDDYFDHIICRCVINYVHQKRALKEAFRVLRPGGWMFLRLENIYWDFNTLPQARDLLNLAFRLRLLFWGLIHSGLGCQPTPGGKIAGFRAYVSPRRFRRILASLDAQIVRYEPSRRGPQYRGHGTQDVALCIRRPVEALHDLAVPDFQ